MQENLKEILSHLQADIEQETLLLYLQNKLPAEKLHDIEKAMANSEFTRDALEGLSQMRDKEKITRMVDSLNRDLKKKVEKKKLFREKLRIKSEPWFYFAIIIFIILIVLCYLLIYRMLRA